MKIEKVQVGIMCRIKIDLGITFWQAIKLRVAGQAYMPIAEKIGQSIVESIKYTAQNEASMTDRQKQEE